MIHACTVDRNMDSYLVSEPYFDILLEFAVGSLLTGGDDGELLCCREVHDLTFND